MKKWIILGIDIQKPIIFFLCKVGFGWNEWSIHCKTLLRTLFFSCNLGCWVSKFNKKKIGNNFFNRIKLIETQWKWCGISWCIQPYILLKDNLLVNYDQNKINNQEAHITLCSFVCFFKNIYCSTYPCWLNENNIKSMKKKMSYLGSPLVMHASRQVVDLICFIWVPNSGL